MKEGGRKERLDRAGEREGGKKRKKIYNEKRKEKNFKFFEKH